MSVTIRLARTGRKNQPAYKIVVSNTRDKRNGRFVDILGHFNPTTTPAEFSYNKEKYEKWSKTGALITEAVKKLIEGKYEYTKYEPRKVEKKERTDTQAQDTKEEAKAEKKAETAEEKKDLPAQAGKPEEPKAEAKVEEIK
jgi:small subunit ribosomal protein S16